jgi:hypothetical protein
VNFRLDGLTVRGIEKIVSGVDSALPDVHKTIESVCWDGR